MGFVLCVVHCGRSLLDKDKTVFPLAVVFGVAPTTRMALEDAHEKAVLAMIEAREALGNSLEILSRLEASARSIASDVADIVVRRHMGECHFALMVWLFVVWTDAP